MSEDQGCVFPEHPAFEQAPEPDPSTSGKAGSNGRGEAEAAGSALSQTREQAERVTDPSRVIRLAEEHVNRNARTCARLLDNEVFLRGPMPTVLVRVEEVGSVREADDEQIEPGVVIDGVRHARGSLVLAEPTPERIQYRLNEQVRFERYDRRAKAWLPKSCPTALARLILGAAPELGFRPCAGIIAVPLFDRGTIVVTPGYHPRTGSIIELQGQLPTLAENPAKSDARRALVTLLAPFRGYIRGKPPTKRQRLRCAFAAAALTAILRPSLPAAPAILLDANVPGAGKGKAARALAVIATGRYPAVITEGPSDEETEKRLASAILSGAPALLLDNLQRTLASSTLESGLTEGVATIRLFGRLVDLTVPCSALVLVTANNAALRADMLRRTLPVRIVADTEQPELRQFAFEPYEAARRHRLAIIAAGLTIAKAWWAVRETARNEQDRLIRDTTLGSFEHWAELVAGAVEWLTGTNPVRLIEDRKAEDPRRGDERAVILALAAWQATRPAGPWWSAKEAAGGIDIDLWAGVIHAKGERPDNRQVGNWLRARRDRVFSDLQLTGEPDRKGVMAWTLRLLPSAGSAGSAGSAPTPPRKTVGQNFGLGEDQPGETRQTRQQDDDEEFDL
jgi:putative DNA primase/helicase